MIHDQNIYDQQVKNKKKIYENIQKITRSKGDNSTISCLLDYTYCKENYQLIAIDLSKEQTLNANPNAIYQINFKGNIHQKGYTTIFFIIEEVKEDLMLFHKEI